MRKALAGLLIRTAHRIYPPKVTQTWDLPLSSTIHVADEAAMNAALAKLSENARAFTHQRFLR